MEALIVLYGLGNEDLLDFEVGHGRRLTGVGSRWLPITVDHLNPHRTGHVYFDDFRGQITGAGGQQAAEREPQGRGNASHCFLTNPGAALGGSVRN